MLHHCMRRVVRRTAALLMPGLHRDEAMPPLLLYKHLADDPILESHIPAWFAPAADN